MIESHWKIFSKHSIDIVIHTAAYKHVPLCEANPKSAVKNNIVGAMNIFDGGYPNYGG